MKNDEWRMTNDEWRMTNDEWRMTKQHAASPQSSDWVSRHLLCSLSFSFLISYLSILNCTFSIINYTLSIVHYQLYFFSLFIYHLSPITSYFFYFKPFTLTMNRFRSITHLSHLSHISHISHRFSIHNYTLYILNYTLSSASGLSAITLYSVSFCH